MEEFNVFRTMKVLEDQEDSDNIDEDDDDYIEGDENRYTVKTKSREKIKYDPIRFRNWNKETQVLTYHSSPGEL